MLYEQRPKLLQIDETLKKIMINESNLSHSFALLAILNFQELNYIIYSWLATSNSNNIYLNIKNLSQKN